jgi:hypothetical protein
MDNTLYMIHLKIATESGYGGRSKPVTMKNIDLDTYITNEEDGIAAVNEFFRLFKEIMNDQNK